MFQPVSIFDIEKYAKEFLPKKPLEQFLSGAAEGLTVEENIKAFRRLRLRPRFLRDVSIVDTSTSILGEQIDFPVCIAPTAQHRLAHPDGEVATAKAASHEGVCMTLSSWSTTSIEEVARTAPGLKWFQLYVFKDKNITKDLVIRAEREGYKALVLTVDTPQVGRNYSDARNKLTMPPHLTLSNFESVYQKLRLSHGNPGSFTLFDVLSDSSLTWDIIFWLKSVTKLPIVLKGILTKEDAVLALQHGCDGILVSNHGGRQLDTVPASIEALPEIIKAVGNKCEVYLDGGVRFGTDVFKAIAVGARAVFVGRPLLWGLAYQGQEGAIKVLKILKDEFKLTMQLMGCTSLKDITPEMVVHESYYSKI